MNLPFFSTLSHYGRRFGTRSLYFAVYRGRLTNGKKLLAITLLGSTAEGLRPNDP